ncbi:hypothetical protein Sme01_03890 [Sphaerisporangium melleum]|uniref:Uncharacterized protein n=1 Tax=Sphaerisporangium melleum TaxID=321316 RepID=A0A917VCT4_9ACTN|nr:hypothetical protein [Sphaerisporangium melleum]GGK61993.1 hypothetical protein GCM10007964_01440 [Sphaerisporangium melleum]GII67913.1 hypothetical protein Sme01_03890 [Sphaerisporangium melleum]
MASQKRQIGICASCNVEGELVGRNLHQNCYLRHYRRGTLDQFPKVRQPARQQSSDRPLVSRQETTSLRREEFARLRKGGVAVEEAGTRIGVSSTTAWRYEAALIETGWCPPARRVCNSPEEIDRIRVALLAHLDRYPALSFSVWDLTRVIDPLHGRTVKNLLGRLASAGLVEVVDGRRDPQSPGVRARRYRSVAGARQDHAQSELAVAS